MPDAASRPAEAGPTRISAEPAPTRLIVSAPAKVNLFLHVTGRRADGYHTLESLFVLIDWADTLTLESRDDGAIVRAQPLPGVDDRDDLAVRAAHALRNATGVTRGVTIAVDKRIPIGAGLGGGSADAASVLLALNRLWHLGLTRSALAEIGGHSGRRRSVLRGGRSRARARHRRTLDARIDAYALAGARGTAGSCEHGGNFRRAEFDTRRAVGENRRLFRGLRAQRSRVRRFREISRRGKRDRCVEAGVAVGADDRIRGRRVRDVRERSGRACGARRRAARIRDPRRAHASSAPARGIRVMRRRSNT